MKKLHRKIIAMSGMLLFAAFNLPAQWTVHDPAWESTFISEVMNSIMQYHQMIEQYLATIRQIEGDYERFQHALRQARNFKFRDVNWDGNFDPFDEMRQMTGQVNSLLNSVRRAKEALTNENITLNGNSYSLLDVVSVSDFSGNGRSAASFAKDAAGAAQSAFRSSAEAWEKGLAPAERQYIWSRFGISPANYRMLQGVGSMTSDRLSRVIADVDTSFREAQEKKLTDMQYSYLSKIMEGGDELSPAETAQLQAAMQSLTIDQLRDLTTTVKDYVSFVSWKAQLAGAQSDAAENDAPSAKIRREAPDNF